MNSMALGSTHTRRGFFARTLGLFSGGLIARWFPAKPPLFVGHDAFSGAPVHAVITQRKIMARWRVTPDMLAGKGYPNSWKQAYELEIQGLHDDLDPPSGQHCAWPGLKRNSTFAAYDRWHQERPPCRI